MDDVEQRAIRAETLIHFGELSHARQVLEGAELAPGNQATLDALQDEERRPPLPRGALPPDLAHHMPVRPFQLDEHIFSRNLRSSSRGAAGGPSGMTMEHLRPLLNDVMALHSFFLMEEQLAQAQVPLAIVNLIRMGRLTALSKPDGGVRGIVAGDVVRRLVARTISQQIAPAVERATSPHQYAMTTRAGCECVAHALQGLTELDPEATVTSIDGVGAFDLISRRAMLEGLREVDDAVLPFARLFYGQQSQYFWETDSEEVHIVPQGEGGEQGDAMMPLLYSLGQHAALEYVSRSLVLGEHLFAFLDDIYVVSKPGRVGRIHDLLAASLWRHSGIRIHHGKTQVWNRARIRPHVCDRLERAAQIVHPEARVWRRSMLPTDRQGVKVLGTPLGHPHYVARHLQGIVEDVHLSGFALFVPSRSPPSPHRRPRSASAALSSRPLCFLTSFHQ